MRYIPAIIIAIAIVLTPVIWIAASSLLQPGGGAPAAMDSSARIEIAEIRVEIVELRMIIDDLRTQIAAVKAMAAQRPAAQAPEQSGPVEGAQTGIDTSAYPEVVLIGDRRKINQGLTVPTSSFLIGLLGRPAEDLGDTCREMTNPELRTMLQTATVGPIRVRMLQPAIESLERVFEKIRQSDEELYRRINTAGTLCVRRVRGSRDSTSAHAYGLAVDLNINGMLDTLGDGKTQLGLTILADFFRDEGWIWGAAFGREDSMHFEVSEELLTQWRAEGKI